MVSSRRRETFQNSPAEESVEGPRKGWNPVGKRKENPAPVVTGIVVRRVEEKG